LSKPHGGRALFGGAAGGGPPRAGAGHDRGLPSTLTVGVIPNVAPDQQSAKYEPLRAYLAETLDVTVKLFVATDYAGVVAALAAGTVDAAYVGGLTYLQAAEQVEVVPLVTEIDRETGTKEYYSGIVVRADAPYDTLGEVLAAKGRFAFGDVSSTSGSAYPRIMLAEAGAECSTTVMDRCPPLSAISFTGGHDATAQAVLNGSADAGGLEVRIMHRLERDGHIPEGELKVVEKALTARRHRRKRSCRQSTSETESRHDLQLIKPDDRVRHAVNTMCRRAEACSSR
jgi:phosphonate transport system substrate-binding protein